MYINGTFYVVPRLFHQLFSTVLSTERHSIPVIHCLMTHKDEELYTALVLKIKRNFSLNFRRTILCLIGKKHTVKHSSTCTLNNNIRMLVSLCIGNLETYPKIWIGSKLSKYTRTSFFCMANNGYCFVTFRLNSFNLFLPPNSNFAANREEQTRRLY